MSVISLCLYLTGFCMEALPSRQFLRVAHFKDAGALCTVVGSSEPINVFVDWAFAMDSAAPEVILFSNRINLHLVLGHLVGTQLLLLRYLIFTSYSLCCTNLA